MNQKEMDRISQAKVATIEEIKEALTNCNVKDIEAVYFDDRPDEVQLEITDESGAVKYVSFGADTDGHTDMTIEELEENNFFMKVVDGITDPKEITLEDLKDKRDKFMKNAAYFNRLAVEIRPAERGLFKGDATPLSDAYRKYFKLNIACLNACVKAIKEREDKENNG